MPPSGSPEDTEASTASEPKPKFAAWTHWILPLLFLSTPLIFLLAYNAPEIYEWLRDQLDLLKSAGTQNRPG